MANSSSEGGRRTNTRTGLPQGHKEEEDEQLKKDCKPHGALHLSGCTWMILIHCSGSQSFGSLIFSNIFVILGEKNLYSEINCKIRNHL